MNWKVLEVRYVHDFSMHKTLFDQVQRYTSSLHKMQCEF
jgi:hypothetical protein